MLGAVTVAVMMIGTLVVANHHLANAQDLSARAISAPVR